MHKRSFRSPVPVLRPATKKPLHIKSVLGLSFGFLGLGTMITEFTIKRSWKEIVGENISKKTEPLRLKRSTLYVTVESSAWMTELRFHKKEIIEKINSKLGEKIVADIIFKLGKPTAIPVTAKPEKARRKKLSAEDKNFIEKTASAVKDPAIRSAVRKALRQSKSFSR